LATGFAREAMDEMDRMDGMDQENEGERRGE
jgi:hypothetical protein